MVATKLGKKIKDILYLKKMTQTDLAKKTKVHRQVLVNWLNGTRKPKMENLQKIAKALNISVEDLLDDNKNFSDVNFSFFNTGTNKQTIAKSSQSIEVLKEKLKLREEKIKFLEEKIKFLESKKKW